MSTNSALSRPRKVTFSDYSRMAVFVQDDNAVKSSRWYSSQDRSRFRRELIQDVRRMSRPLEGTPAGATHIYHLIGIEPFVHHGVMREVQEAKRAHLYAVLLEQKLQAQLGVQDPTKLSKASENSSHWARSRARKFAELYSGL